MHLDIDASAIRGEVHLFALLAPRITYSTSHEHGAERILMIDPTGNEFYVCDFGNFSADVNAVDDQDTSL